MSINTHVRMLDELLENITTAAELKELYASVPYVKFYIESSVNDTWTPIDISKLDIKRNEYHRSMAGAFLLNRFTVQIVRDVIIEEKGSILTKNKQFLALSSMLWVGESKILEAVLNKDISILYPAITHDLICKSLT